MILAVSTLVYVKDDGIDYTAVNDAFCDIYTTHTSNFICHFDTYCWHDYINKT